MKAVAVSESWPKVRPWLPTAVLLTGLVLTLAATFFYTKFANAQDRRRFDLAAEEVRETVQGRLDTYVALLRGGSALLTVKPDLTRADWREYVQRLRVEEFYPGVQGIGISLRVRAQETNALVARLRGQGLADFQIQPDTPREEYHVIVYLEPLDKRNVAALGYDMYTDPVRRVAMEQAAATAMPAASGKVRLVQEIEGPKQAGFLIYVPVYASGVLPDNEAERRGALRGFVYSAFRAGDFFSALFGAAHHPELQMEVYDGPSAAGAALMHRFQTMDRADKPRFRAARQVLVAGRPWAMVFSSLPQFEQTSTRVLGVLIPLGGTLLSLLLYYFTRREAVLRHAAETSAANLGEQREHLRVTLESIGDAVIATDAEGNVDFVNRPAQSLTGWTMEEAKGRRLGEVFRVLDEEAAQPLEDPVSQVRREGKAVTLAEHSMLVARDGTQRSIEDSAAPIRDARGELLGVVLVFRDVTEQRRFQRRNAAQHGITRILAESHTLADAAPGLLEGIGRNLQFDCGYLWWINPGSQVATCTASWEKPGTQCCGFTERSRASQFARGEGLPGRVWSSGAAAWVEEAADDRSLPRYAEARQAGLRSAFAFPIRRGNEVCGVVEFFTRLSRPADEDLLKTMEAIGMQIGQFLARREAEAYQAQQAKQSMLRAETASAFAMPNASFREVLQRCAELLVRYVPAAFGRIWTLNSETDVLELQASAGMYTHIDGPHGRVPVGKYKIGLIAKEARPHLTNSVLTDPRISNPEWAKAEGMVAFAGYPLISGGRVIGVMALFARQILPAATLDMLGGVADIVAQGIERKRAEDALEEANRELERRVAERTAKLQEAVSELEAFSYSVSHDMRAPLRAMQSFSLILQEEAGQKLSADEREYLVRIIKASDRLDQLIHDVLAYSRISRVPLELHNVDVERVVHDLIQQHPSLQSPNAEVVVESPLLRVVGDKGSVTQCLCNLLTNAVKFVGPGVKPRVRIWTEPVDGEVRAWVEDNGIGIPAEYREKIFGMFQRLHGPTNYEGTGIGLAIVKKAVERMDGQVGVESEEGKGSRFWIQLRRAR